MYEFIKYNPDIVIHDTKEDFEELAEKWKAWAEKYVMDIERFHKEAANSTLHFP